MFEGKLNSYITISPHVISENMSIVFVEKIDC